MARRVSDYRIRRIADRGNEKVDRDPGNISEIKRLRRRVRDLEIQHEIRENVAIGDFETRHNMEQTRPPKAWSCVIWPWAFGKRSIADGILKELAPSLLGISFYLNGDVIFLIIPDCYGKRFFGHPGRKRILSIGNSCCEILGNVALSTEFWCRLFGAEKDHLFSVCGCDVRGYIWEVVGVGKGRSSGIQFKGALEMQLVVQRQLHEQVEASYISSSSKYFLLNLQLTESTSRILGPFDQEA
nr:hypothetical protein [Tanacetum cinerariifolium]